VVHVARAVVTVDIDQLVDVQLAVQSSLFTGRLRLRLPSGRLRLRLLEVVDVRIGSGDRTEERAREADGRQSAERGLDA